MNSGSLLNCHSFRRPIPETLSQNKKADLPGAEDLLIFINKVSNVFV